MTGLASLKDGFQGNAYSLVKLGLFLWVIFCLAHLVLPDAPAVLMAARAPVGLVPLCAIQGNGDRSPYDGQFVETSGIVYADFETLPMRGFYLQHEDCDNSLQTSDGLFVFTGGGADLAASGDLVEVAGLVQEYGGQTEIKADASGVEILSRGNPLPVPLEIEPPQEIQTAAPYLETLEGMHVRMAEALVTGPTDSTGETWVVDASLGIERVFNDQPDGAAALIRVSAEGHFKVSPPAKVTDRAVGLQGALDGTGGIFTLHLLLPPVLHPGDLPQETGAPLTDSGFTLATFNLANLFDSIDDPLTDDSVLPPSEYQRRLQKRSLAIHEILAEPDILVLQEAENQAVLQALVNRPEIVADYGIVWQDGPDQRGLDIALLYRQDRAALLGFQVRQGCTDLIDGLGPDGNGDVANPANSLTCDLNGDGILDGNRLFSRPPLAVRLRIANVADPSSPFEVTVIGNHWKSKVEDTSSVQHTLPRRIQQAQFLASWLLELHDQAADSHMIIAGDLNDVPASAPISILEASGARDLTRDLEKNTRYSLIFQGISQIIDYVMVLPSIKLGAAQVRAMHINADFPAVFSAIDAVVYRSSDHDPVWVNMFPFTEWVYLPQVHPGQ